MTCFAVVWTTRAYDDKCSILSSYYPSAGSHLIPGQLEDIFKHNDFEQLKNDCRNAKLHFQMTFSLSSTSCLLKLPINYSETELTITQSLRQHFTAFLISCFITPDDSEVIICRNIKIFHQVRRSPPSMKNSEVSSPGIEWPVVNLRMNSAIDYKIKGSSRNVENSCGGINTLRLGNL